MGRKGIIWHTLPSKPITTGKSKQELKVGTYWQELKQNQGGVLLTDSLSTTCLVYFYTHPSHPQPGPQARALVRGFGDVCTSTWAELTACDLLLPPQGPRTRGCPSSQADLALGLLSSELFDLFSPVASVALIYPPASPQGSIL